MAGPSPMPHRAAAASAAPWPSPAMGVAVAVGFVSAGTVAVALSADVAGGPAILAGRWGILARLALWCLAWVLGVGCALRLPPRMAVLGVVVAAAALRVAALAGPPPLSDDLFRYAWDGRVQAAGIDPYRHPPDHPALAPLRDSWLWPEAGGCAALNRPPGCTRINRPSEPTIYPPLAEAWFGAVYRLFGIEARHKSWQVAGLVSDLGLVVLLAAALRRRGSDPRWAALYALSPFPVIEVVGNGHVDGLAALLLVAALVVVSGHGPARGPRPPGAGVEGAATRAARGTAPVRLAAAGALVGAATLVKLYPALALAALVGAGGPGRRHRALTRAGVAFALVLVIGYLPHVVAVGGRVLGYLPGYLREEEYHDGGRFLLADALLPDPAASVAGVLAVAVLTGWVLYRRPQPAAAATVLLGGPLLVATPVQPWYGVSLLAVATLAVRPAWGAVTAAGYPFFFAVILDHPAATVIGRCGYGLALAVVMIVALRRSRRCRTDGRCSSTRARNGTGGGARLR